MSKLSRRSPSCVDNFLTANEFFKYNVNNQLADIETNVASTGGLRLQNPQMDGSNYILAGYNYSATQNNGQITSMQDGREGYSVTYQYDLLKRLVSATAGSTWTQTFGYDGFGNLTSKSTPSGSSETPLPGVNPAKNWLSGYTYDPNGNVGSYNNFNLGYDPANRLSYATTGSFTEIYGYDAANHRIERVNSSLDTVYFFSPSGKLLSMFNCLSTCTLISNRVYFGGMLLGTDGTPGQGVTLDANFDTFTWTDRLGSAQPTYPYGADIGTPPAADAPDFATYTKEGTTGLEYAMNRYFSGGLGRFMTVDVTIRSARISRPQTWNRFSYSSNDPVNRFDRSGTCDDVASDADWSVTVCGDDDIFAPFSFGLGAPRGNDPSSSGSRQSQVRALALGYQKAVSQGIISDCDALAGFAGDLANQAQSVKEFVHDFSVLTPPSPATGGPAAKVTEAVTGVNFSAGAVQLNTGQPSGYLTSFQNTLPDPGTDGTNGDQGHHFAAFFQFGYHNGSALGSVTAFWFEYFEGTSSGIMNLGDVNLGEVAAQIGSDLASGKISMDDVEERIEALCSQ